MCARQSDCFSPAVKGMLRALSGTRAFSVLDRRALEQAVAYDPSLHLCPMPDCTFVASWCGEDDGPLAARERAGCDQLVQARRTRLRWRSQYLRVRARGVQHAASHRARRKAEGGAHDTLPSAPRRL